MAKTPHIMLSYSKVKTYECPKKYYYQYVKRLPRDFNARNTLPGRAIQKLFELFVNNGEFKRGSKWLYQNLPQIFESEYMKFEETTRFHVNESYDSTMDDVAEMIPNCYDLFVKKKWNKGKVASEVTLKTQISDRVSLMGQLDFIVQTDKEVVLIDFKSTARGISALDKEQLVIYAYLYYRNFGKYPDHVYFFLTRDNKLVRLNIDQQVVDDTLNRLNNVANGIRKKNYQKNPSRKNCRYCPFKQTCWGSAKKCPW